MTSSRERTGRWMIARIIVFSGNAAMRSHSHGKGCRAALALLAMTLLVSSPVFGVVTANGSRVCDSNRTALAAIDASYTLADNNDKIIFAAGANDFLCVPGSGFAGHTLQYRILAGTWANMPTSNGSGPFLAASGTVLVNNTTVSSGQRRAKLTGDNGVYKPDAKQFTTSTTLDYQQDFEDDHSEGQWALDFSTCGGSETYEFRVRWGTDDCGDQYVVYPSQITTAGGTTPVTMSSAANQAFFVGDAATAMSTVTITDATPASITTANDIRIRVPAGFNMTWDASVTTATIGGAASSNVSTTVSYEDSDATAVLNVTTSFGDGDVITVSGLRFTAFTAASTADSLEIEVNNDDAVTATDDKTIAIGAPTFRSIGTTAGDLYSVGTASTTAGSPVVTFAGGAVLPAFVGLGDKLTIGGGGPTTLFSDNFTDGVITGWTDIGADPMAESGGVFRTVIGANTYGHYSVDSGGAWADYVLTTDFKGVDNDISGCTFRVQDANNYYLVSQGFGDNDLWNLRLQKVVGGTATDLGASPINNQGGAAGQVNNLTAWYAFKVELSGTSIKVYVDNVLKYDITDGTFATGTVGLWVAGQKDSEFDNALVTSGGGSTDFYVQSRDSDTQVTLQADAGSTLTNQTYSFERCYNTMQAWETDNEGDLVTDTRRAVGVCYNDSAFTDRLVISGSTTDASYFMMLTVPPGERHNGIANSGARIDAGGGWTSQNAINVEDEYTRIEWIEITDVYDAGDAIYFDDSPAADNSSATGVFVHGFWQAGNAAFRVAADNVTIRNCVATGGTTYAARIESTGSVMIESCTFWGFSGGGYGVSGAASSAVSVRNTISVDHGTLDMYIETGGGATIPYFGYNMFRTYGGGFDPGSYAGNNQWPPANLDHLFVDTSTSDLHLLVSGNRAGNTGLDLSSDFSDDIDGATRTGTWDIGADEARTGTDPATPKILVWQEIER